MKKQIRFQLEKSPSHLFLLTTFIRPRRVDDNPTEINWELILGEPYRKAVDRLLQKELLIECGVNELLDYKYTVAMLKRVLREQELSASNSDRKHDLILKLIQDGDLDSIESLNDTIILQCSDQGRHLALAYLQKPEEFIKQIANENKKNKLARILEFILAASIGGVIENITWGTLVETFHEIIPQLQKIIESLRMFSNMHNETSNLKSRINEIIEEINALVDFLRKREQSDLVELTSLLRSSSQKLGTVISFLKLQDHSTKHATNDILTAIAIDLSRCREMVHVISYSNKETSKIELAKIIHILDHICDRFADIRNDLLNINPPI